jgi:hypothetical protein
MTRAILLVLLCLSAAVPPMVPSAAPPEDVDLAPLLTLAGCSGGGEELSCPAGSAAGGLGCESLARVAGLGGLEPREPLALCLFRGGDLPASEYVLGPRGMRRIYRRYLAADSSGLHLIKSAAALRARYAPIESADEARSLALALTGYSELRRFSPPAGYRYFVKALAETSAKPAADGFLVENLRDDQVFGCGPHPTFLVSVAVGRDGSLKETRRERAFEDPATDNLCVD